MVVTESTASEAMLSTAPEGTIMHEIYHSTMKDNPKAFASYNPDVMEQVLSQENNLLFGDSTFTAGKPDYVALNIPERVRVPVGWTFPKDSELTSLFSYHLLKMHEAGIIHKIFNVIQRLRLVHPNMSFTKFLFRVGCTLQQRNLACRRPFLSAMKTLCSPSCHSVGLAVNRNSRRLEQEREIG